MRFTKTEQAAKAEKRSKWDLIESIVADALANELDIAGTGTVFAAMEAFEKAGDEYALSTVRKFCTLADFHHEATPAHRKVFRTYGTSLVSNMASAGLTPGQAAKFLGAKRRSYRDVRDELKNWQRPSGGAATSLTSQTLDQRLAGCLTQLNSVLTEMGQAVHEAETSDQVVELGAYAQLAVALYHRFVESQLDTEIRQMYESERV